MKKKKVHPAVSEYYRQMALKGIEAKKKKIISQFKQNEQVGQSSSSNHV